MVTLNLTSKTVTSTVKRGQTGSNGVKRGRSIPYHHQQGTPHPTPTPTGDRVWPPVLPRFTVDVTVFKVKFDVTAFDVNFFDDIIFRCCVFDVTYFPQSILMMLLLLYDGLGLFSINFHFWCDDECQQKITYL